MVLLLYFYFFYILYLLDCCIHYFYFILIFFFLVYIFLIYVIPDRENILVIVFKNSITYLLLINCIFHFIFSFLVDNLNTIQFLTICHIWDTNVYAIENFFHTNTITKKIINRILKIDINYILILQINKFILMVNWPSSRVVKCSGEVYGEPPTSLKEARRSAYRVSGARPDTEAPARPGPSDLVK